MPSKLFWNTTRAVSPRNAKHSLITESQSSITLNITASYLRIPLKPLPINDDTVEQRGHVFYRFDNSIQAAC